MSDTLDLQGLQTEARNQGAPILIYTLDLCQIINNEDATVTSVIKPCIPTIAAAIDTLTQRIRRGGRVIYVGAGTSGRLGVLDASEIPPTYSASPAQFVALIAGGDVALRSAKEGAEDSLEGAVDDLDALHLNGDTDSLIGIAASGRTPYVISSLAFAKSKGCVTIGIACSAPSAMSSCGDVDFMINAVTGPEVVTGSTRMKAGTATKLVLNMLSTGIMIKVGKTFGNIMIDVNPTNVKLQQRARRILRDICGDRCPETEEELDYVLQACNRSVKLAAAHIYLGVSIDEARFRLDEANGVLANLLRAPQSIRSAERCLAEEVKYVLCVDGGGSKCKAVILGDDGAMGTGEAGPCNPSDIGVETAVAAIYLALRRAVNSCPAIKEKSPANLSFAEAWIGLAGCDRKPLDRRVRLEMERLLGEQPNMTMNVTNDIELLATAAGHRFGATDIIVLIAGTGSVAMRYRWVQNKFCKVGRSGGWGALLGDDGSGFEIGRQAIRAAFRSLEEQENLGRPIGAVPPPDLLPELILNHFRPTDAAGDESFDLLSSVLLAGSEDAQSASQTKRRIASCAKVVIDAISISEMAEKIVTSAVERLFGLVQALCRPTKDDDRGPVIVLAGGVFQSKVVREILTRKLEHGLIHVASVEMLDNPAWIGAQFLAQKFWATERKP